MIPSTAVADAKTAQAATGASDLAAALALAVAGPETGYGYDPGAAGDYMIAGHLVAKGTPGAVATSFGYTQLHTDAGGDGGGVGNGHSVAELTDGVSNFKIAMVEIQRRLNEGADELEAIGPWSTRVEAVQHLGEAQEAISSISREMIPAEAGGGAAIGALLIAAIAAAVLLDW